MKDFQLVIMAGGKGTRISSIANDIPKPMIRIADKPVLEHQIEFFKNQNIKDITISIGHLGNVIQDYFGNGKKFDVNIRYIVEDEPLGTAGALKFTFEQPKLLLVVNSDIIFDFDLERMFEYHENRNADITLFTHPNQHPYDSAIIDTDDKGRIVKWFNKEDKREDVPNRVNAGIHIINRDVLNIDSWSKKKVDLDRDILKPMILDKRIFAYDSPEYVKDMGTPERYHQVERDIKSGIVNKKNLKKRQKAIFLDRDGTINKYAGFITQPNQIELINGVSEAIKKINQSEYLAIVVSNQPVIARGECTFEEMKRIHNHLEMLLGLEGAYLNDITFCPHHTDKGFEGEIPELKFDCECRKPKPGMLLKMADKYNIELSDSYMIGDSERDIEAGKAVGCHTIYLGENITKADYCAKNLLEALQFIFKKE